MTWEARHLAQSIERDPGEVAAFAGAYENLPRWAGGLSAGIRRDGDRWITDSPMGAVGVRFTGPVELGILDHDVTLPDGTVVHNPLRVLRNDAGAEVVFTLYRLPRTTDEAFEQDAAHVRADLARLRDVLESARR
ncbi:SRPBCC family protein [Microbacterium sp. X-17]|uniref:SRPBCC family protein n=1 Tax=Microbacterium sp. X-17 TaxID=3144404 RepID=UPI0031F4C5E6